MVERLLPSTCPSCGHLLEAKRLGCGHCGTSVEGAFRLPVLLRLAPEDQEFVLNFLRCSGALKEMAQIYRVSYPTVRNRLDALIERIRKLEAEHAAEREEAKQ